MIDNYQIEYVVNVGSAATANNELEIGDIVIAEKLVQHDFDITAFGHKKGYISTVGENVQCDKVLIEKFKAAIAQVCYLDKVPFIVIRSISDSPNGNNNITFE